MSSGAHSALADFITRHPRLFVLTGAGCSTASGIPDYRDAAGEWKRRRPVLYQDFIANADMRRRYWARSLVGWQRIRHARPNGAHAALARLEAAGAITHLVTQNVDGLHQAAGSRRVLDLHGRLDIVRCLGCDASLPRQALQRTLATANPGWATLDAPTAPDGDADLEFDDDGFVVPGCTACGGLLKPDVVFYGESVPRVRVAQAMRSLDAADAMLIIGSSLMVYSGYRFAAAAARTGKPIAAVNIGRTRADDLLALKIAAPCAEALAGLAVGGA